VTQTGAASSTPPSIAINGDNPAVIHGDSYADLGATITGPTTDLTLGIKTFLNGQLVSTIVIGVKTLAWRSRTTFYALGPVSTSAIT